MHCPSYVPKELVHSPFNILLIIDVYWDNTGGEILDAVYLNANDFARIVACGFVSNYGNPKPYGLVNYGLIAHKRLHVQGFIQTDLIQEYYMVCRESTELMSGLHERYGELDCKRTNYL